MIHPSLHVGLAEHDDLEALEVWSDDDGAVYVKAERGMSFLTFSGPHVRTLLTAMLQANETPDSHFKFPASVPLGRNDAS